MPRSPFAAPVVSLLVPLACLVTCPAVAKIDEPMLPALEMTDPYLPNVFEHPHIVAADLMVFDGEGDEIREAVADETIVVDVEFEMSPLERAHQVFVVQIMIFSAKHGWVTANEALGECDRNAHGVYRDRVEIKCPSFDGKFEIRCRHQGKLFISKPFRVLKR